MTASNEASAHPRSALSDGLRPLWLQVVPVLTCIVWGGNVVAIRLALMECPPFWVAGARAVIATISLVAWIALSADHLPTMPRRLASQVMLLGLLTTAVFALLNMALQRASASLVVILLYLYPLFTALFGHFLLRDDRTSPRLVVGLALGFGGAALAISSPHALPSGTRLIGAILAVSSALAWAAYTTLTKRLLARVGQMTLLLYPTVISAVLFVGASLLLEPPQWRVPSAATMLALSYQGLLAGTAANIAWLVMMRHVRVSVLTSYTFLTPVAGSILSALVLNEHMSIRHAVAVLLVAAALVVVNARGGRLGLSATRPEPPRTGGTG